MIRGVLPTSMLDWPGHVASVMFLGGCNWICEYCHNRELHTLERLSFDQAMKVLEPVRDMVDHIIISGGEPTLWKDYLENLIDELKKEGYHVGMHTNGSSPHIVRHLLSRLEFVGVDIKGGEHTYSEWIHGANLNGVETTVRILQLSDIDHEFRSTIYPPYVDDTAISSLFDLLRKWHIREITLQQFMGIDDTSITPVKYGDLKTLVDKYSDGVTVFYRGFDKFVVK